MNKFYLNVGLTACGALLLLSGCMDDKYDLSDIDTTTRIRVNNLVVPLNLDAIKLDDVIDLGDNKNVKEVTDPEGRKVYAITQTGTIDSDPITIAEILISPDDMEPSEVKLKMLETIPGVESSVKYKMENMESTFNFTSTGVDESVKSIKAIETVKNIDMTVSLIVPSNIKLSKIDLEDVEICFPRNLYNVDGSTVQAKVGNTVVGDYDPSTGIVQIKSYTATNTNKIDIDLICNKLMPDSRDLTINSYRDLHFTGEMGVTDNGHVVLSSSAASGLPEEFDIRSEYALTAFNIKNFSGDIDYIVDGVDIDPIDLDDLPDFLDNDQNNVIMANPQIYLGATNTAAKYQAEGSATIAMKSEFNSGLTNSTVSPEFVIGCNKGPVVYNIVLSPAGNDLKPLADYSENLTKYQFTGLKYILSAGNDKPAGIPKTIDLSLDNPHFYGNVVRFPIEAPGLKKSEYEIPGITGDYEFFAPLAFDVNTNIIYSKVNNDWDSEDLKDLAVTRLKLDALAKSNLPAEVALTIYPINENEEHLGRSQELLLPALASEKISLVIEAESEDNPIMGIHGLDYRAIVRQLEKGAGEALSPDQTLELTDIRITVSGYYTKEF